MNDEINIKIPAQILDYVDTHEHLLYLFNYITNLQQENKRLKQNQVKVLNRIRDFIHSSKCEIVEGYYCDDKHSQYWEMFKQFAEELQDKIKGLDTKYYVYIPKWREQELLSKEEQLKDYKSRIEKAVEYLKSNEDNLFMSFSDDFLDHDELLDKKIGMTLLNILEDV